MGAIYKRQGSRILVKTDPSNSLILLNRSIRDNDGFIIRVSQFIDPLNDRTWYAMDRIRMSMISTEGQTSGFFGASGNGGRRGLVQCEKPCYLLIQNYTEARLLNEKGEILAGSNIFADGGGIGLTLCLGDSISPFTLQPVDLLLFNTANRDLGWQGSFLQGEWVTYKPRKKAFEIKEWPTLKPWITIPKEVLDEFKS